MKTEIKKVLSHKWERGDLGLPPYKLVGIWSQPSQALLEANPMAYNAQMDSRPKPCHFSCDHCGMGIRHHYIVKSADKKVFCVGSSCIKDLGDSKLIEQAKYEKNKLARKAAKEKREKNRIEKQKAYDAEMDLQKEKNNGLTDFELKKKNMENALCLARANRIIKGKVIIDALRNAGGDFCESMKAQLINDGTFSKNCERIIIEIGTKKYGRKNSKLYNEHYPIVEKQFNEIFQELKK